jgi:hypothetical protein
MAKVTHFANTLSGPSWAGDFFDREHLMPGGAKIDAAQFNEEGSVTVTVGATGAAQSATSVPVAALSGAIPSGTVLRFSADEYATLSAAAAAGATSITVEALVNALESGDAATYQGTLGRTPIVSGTVIGRTYAERDASTPFGPAGDSDDEIYLVAFDVTDAEQMNDVELYRPGSIVKENLLPVFSALSSTLKSKLRTAYHCTTGAA